MSKRIKKRSPSASSLFTQIDLFLSSQSPLDESDAHFDTLKNVYTQQQKRWNAICDKAELRQSEVERLWEDWNKFLSEHDRLEHWIAEQAKSVSEMEATSARVTYESLDDIERDLETIKEGQTSRLPQLDSLNDLYCDLAREYRLDSSDDLKTRFIGVNNHWEDLATNLDALLKKIRNSRQLYINYRGLR